MTAFLALWNSVDRAGVREEYEAWHAFEHVPERVALPGFLGARRYRADAATPGAAPDYFTLYELQGLEALHTPQYQDVVDRPTPWSARMRPHLSDFVRRPCLLQGCVGESSGAQLATVRWSTADPQAWCQAAAAAMLQSVESGQLLRVTLGTMPPGASVAYPVGAAQTAAAAPGETAIVLLAEHQDVDALDAGAAALLHTLTPLTTTDPLQARFTLQSQVGRSALPLRGTERLPGRPGLMSRYNRDHSQ